MNSSIQLMKTEKKELQIENEIQNFLIKNDEQNHALKRIIENFESKKIIEKTLSELDNPNLNKLYKKSKKNNFLNKILKPKS